MNTVKVIVHDGINHENIYPFDVDGTLIGLKRYKKKPKGNSAKVQCPLTGLTYFVRVNQPHIDLMKTMRARGRFILVWSANGHAWARAVVKALGIREWVDFFMTKPLGSVDDVKPNDWMCHHIFLGPVEEDRK